MRVVLALLLGLVASVTSVAVDWPQYRGPLRNDVSAETGLLQAWPKEGPLLLWAFADARIGCSRSAIVGERLFTIVGRGEDEFLIALNLSDVKNKSVAQAWATRIGPTFHFKGNSWNAGPNSTPTVDDELVFTLVRNCCFALTCRPRNNRRPAVDHEYRAAMGWPLLIGYGRFELS